MIFFFLNYVWPNGLSWFHGYIYKGHNSAIMPLFCLSRGCILSGQPSYVMFMNFVAALSIIRK